MSRSPGTTMCRTGAAQQRRHDRTRPAVPAREAAAFGEFGAAEGVKGLHHLRTPLGRPGTDVSAGEPAAVASGHAGIAVTESDTAEIADRQALAAYHHRLRDIDTELDEAADRADQGRLDRLRLEREALLDEVRTGTSCRYDPDPARPVTWLLDPPKTDRADE
ncbi:hypothetical protein [Kitasatospora sp. NPDC054795]